MKQNSMRQQPRKWLAGQILITAFTHIRLLCSPVRFTSAAGDSTA